MVDLGKAEAWNEEKCKIELTPAECGADPASAVPEELCAHVY
jgi:hypothetical protein